MYSNKNTYINTFYQKLSAHKSSESGGTSVEKNKPTIETSQANLDRKKERQKKDMQAAKKSPKQAEKLKSLNTKVTIDRKEMTIEQVLNTKNNDLIAKIPNEVVKTLDGRRQMQINKIKTKKEQEETKKEQEETKKEQNIKENTNLTAKDKEENTNNKKQDAEKQKQDAEKQKQDAEKQKQDAEKQKQDAENKSISLEEKIRIFDIRNSSLSKKLDSVKKLIPQEKLGNLNVGKINAANSPEFQKLKKAGISEDVIRTKYKATIQADYVARNYENFAPKKNTPQYSIYINRVNSIRHTLSMPSVSLKPTRPNITHLVNSTVLGDKREAVMNIAQDAGKSGNYESVKFDAQNDEIVFENKTNENKLVIDTGSVPPVSRMETKDGFFIETPIKEAKNPDDLKRADTYEAVQKLTEKSIDQKAAFKTPDTTNPQIQKALIALGPDAKDYIESQNNFLNEMESTDKPKTTEQKIKDAENLQMKITALKDKEKTTASQRLLQSIQSGMNETNSDLPLERTLGQQEIELTEHIKTLKELTEAEKTAEILEKRRMEKENKEMEAMQKNMNEVTRAGWDRLGPEAVNGIVGELNRGKPEQAQIRLGETPLLDSQKRKLNEAVTKVLDKTRGTQNANLNIQEQYVANRQILTSIGLRSAEKEKLILASQKSETSADSLAQIIRSETESVAV